MKMKVTPQIKSATKAVLEAMAAVAVIEPKVTAIKAKILAEGLFTTEDGERITEVKKWWLMGDVNFETYMQQLYAAYIAAGYDVVYGYCPLAIAQETLRLAENTLITLVCDQLATPGFNLDALNCKMNARKEFMDLNLRYLTQFVK